MPIETETTSVSEADHHPPIQIAIDISMYPLRADYEKPIITFIQNLKSNPQIKVVTNELSTQLIGDYDTVFSVLQSTIRASFLDGETQAFVLKVLNVEIEGGKILDI